MKRGRKPMLCGLFFHILSIKKAFMSFYLSPIDK